ncbi:MAG TPA: hypothetical protein VFX10_04385 [Nitrospira sp.]|nr:hypothetical protein [Nitrospira sp.]
MSDSALMHGVPARSIICSDGCKKVRDKRIRQENLIAIVSGAMTGIVVGGLNPTRMEAAYGRADA